MKQFISICSATIRLVQHQLLRNNSVLLYYLWFFIVQPSIRFKIIMMMMIWLSDTTSNMKCFIYFVIFDVSVLRSISHSYLSNNNWSVKRSLRHLIMLTWKLFHNSISVNDFAFLFFIASVAAVFFCRVRGQS
jgi:hypothetical protein